MEMFVQLVFLAILTTSLCACEKEGHDSVTDEDMAKAMERLSFVCTQEADHLPAIGDDAQALYRYALSLDLSEGAKDYQPIGRYYRLAYAAGNYRAATNLHGLIAQGVVESASRSKEVIDIVKDLIARGIPGGYYDMGHYLEIGYGVKRDTSSANAYFRKAADQGNPDAQYYVARLLSKIPDTADVMQSMYKCAMEQGNGPAGVHYASYSKVVGRYADAVTGFHTAIRNGDYDAARNLERAFKGPPPSEELYYMALQRDEERVERLEKVRKFLTDNQYLGPKVPDIDQIVPLPPAKLPDWDGTFEWLKKSESTPPAEKPSEDMIRTLSQAKELDPATGMPLTKK
ncbi:Sel1 repeat-containing protein [Pseudomonas coronafaciens pv. oryzae]|nr:Sel1 repeat-containing protein [Pseudomonas coronafaciens pv. oryzae]KPY05356.1 Sel1 repeat-containing protein [Pseudomonas coronafaciens pv. oryzae]RMT08634.1 Sel1 repeat-containing protein [Pseudomonas coronafaciens pv. oryzae]